MDKNIIIQKVFEIAYMQKNEFINILEDNELSQISRTRLIAILEPLSAHDYILAEYYKYDKDGPIFKIKLTQKGEGLASNKEKLNNNFPIENPKFCFVIMSFNDKNKELIDIYSAIKRAVINYGFDCKRVDEIDENRRITDTIISAIQKAGLIIADLTEARPNCYYELGYAHALEKQVIQTCDIRTPLHFDISTYPTIIYETKSELESRIIDKIEFRIKNGLLQLHK